MRESHAEGTEMPLKSLHSPLPSLGGQEEALNGSQSSPAAGIWAPDRKGTGKATELNIKHKARAPEFRYTNLHSS